MQSCEVKWAAIKHMGGKKKDVKKIWIVSSGLQSGEAT